MKGSRFNQPPRLTLKSIMSVNGPPAELKGMPDSPVNTIDTPFLRLVQRGCIALRTGTLIQRIVDIIDPISSECIIIHKRAPIGFRDDTAITTAREHARTIRA